MNTDHANKGYLSNDKPGARILIVVVIIFKAPIKLLTPAMCKANMEKSTAVYAFYYTNTKYTCYIYFELLPSAASADRELMGHTSWAPNYQNLQ